MPWQRLVADTALEVDPETGRLAYRRVVVTVPRQSGKSTLANSVATHRMAAPAFFGDGQRVIYTAQSRNDARTKWLEDYIPDLEGSAYFGPRITKSKANGSEGHRMPGTNGRFRIIATGDTSGHGGSIDLAHVDEAFSLIDDRLDQALRPAMMTRPQPQTWIWSTRGWAGESPYFDKALEDGAAAVEADTGFGTAFFDWHAPEGMDPDDPETWAVAMPALGHTVTVETIQADRDDMSRAGFERAYLNRSVDRPATTGEAAIDADQWDELAAALPERPEPVVFAVTTSPGREWSTISLAGRTVDGDGEPVRVVQVVDTKPGSTWVVDRLAQLIEEWEPASVVVDSRSDAAALIAPLTARRVKPKPTAMSGRDVALAAGSFAESVADGTVRHYGQELVAVAARHARRRRSSGLWEIAPPPTPSDASPVDVSPLIGVALALAALDAAPTSKPRPAKLATGKAAEPPPPVVPKNIRRKEPA